MSQRADVSRVRLPRAHRPGPTRAGVRPRGGRLGQLFLLGLLAGVSAIVLVLAINQIGGATSSARVERETVTAAKGVVQSTVTGTGNVEPVTDDDVNFQAGGTLRHVYVRVGQDVAKGQLLATLDPTSAELTLKEAEAQLAADEDTLVAAEDLTTATTTTTSTATDAIEETDFVAYAPSSDTTATGTSTTGTSTTGTTTTTAQTTPTTTTTTEPSTTGATSGSSSGGSTSSGSATSSASSAATVASDELTVDKDEEAVKSDKTAVAQTKLRAPEAGTIVSLQSLSVGDTVSSGSDSSASSASDSSGSDSTASSTAATSSNSSSSSSASTTTGFAEIASLHRLSMTVSFDESDISKLKVGQAATVTLEALTGVELAAKVTAISPLGTTSSSVVSYDATLTLEQQDARVKPGMSASAAVIVSQGQGVTVPNDAVTGTGALGTVSEDVNGKSVSKQVVVGRRGDSRTVITSGLSAGAQLFVTTTLPSATATTSSGSSSSSSGTLGGLSSSSGVGAAGGFAGGGAGRGGPP